MRFWAYLERRARRLRRALWSETRLKAEEQRIARDVARRVDEQMQVVRDAWASGTG